MCPIGETAEKIGLDTIRKINMVYNLSMTF